MNTIRAIRRLLGGLAFAAVIVLMIAASVMVGSLIGLVAKVL